MKQIRVFQIGCGKMSKYIMKYIYDLGGNVYEWTMESSNDCSRVNRGRQLP